MNEIDTNKNNELKLSFDKDESTLFQLEDETENAGRPPSYYTDPIDFRSTFAVVKTSHNNVKSSVGINYVVRENIFKPCMTSDSLNVESFKFLKISNLQAWEFRFINDCKNHLETGIEMVTHFFADNTWNINF